LNNPRQEKETSKRHVLHCLSDPARELSMPSGKCHFEPTKTP
jgi:hypothetical protein